MVAKRPSIPALRVHQWMSLWDLAPFDESEHRDRPRADFFVFSMSARDLRSLVGIERRSASGGRPRSQDLGVQRRHDRERSDEIARFVKYGFPWSELSQRKRNSGEFDDLRKPGWLPTAIIVNLRGAVDRRTKAKIPEKDRILIESSGDAVSLRLPEGFSTSWRPDGVHPVEVIDGQHRLWAFEGQVEQEFQLPVVAFDDLDISWQAYLFWTINIRPKRINASLAFDLYPLLRTEDWLDRFEGHSIYRETRAQELTEALWSYHESPWYQRINMLGERGGPAVTQAAWIRSLIATYIKPVDRRRRLLGGLFGAPVGEDNLVLPWTRVQQAAFVILAWQELEKAIEAEDFDWAEALREKSPGAVRDPAFAGPLTLLNTDQGVRAFLHVTNDLVFINSAALKLAGWIEELEAAPSDAEALSEVIARLRRRHLARFVKSLAGGVASYDWRTAAAPGLTDDQRSLKRAFRGTGGYKELRVQLLTHLADAGSAASDAAVAVLDALGISES